MIATEPTGGALKYALLLGVLVAGCNSDLATKEMVGEELERGETVELIGGYLELVHTHNDSAAFGMLQQIDPDLRRPLLIAAQSTASLALLVLIVIWRRKSTIELLPYLLVLSGALGNVIDRVRYGYVVDFIHFHVGRAFSWPIFNVADVLISVGVGLILLQLLRRRSAEPV